MSSKREHDRWAGKEVFTTGEAAEICKVSQQTIIRCFDAGRVTGFRVPGSRFRRIPRASLLAFMKANRIDTTPLGERSGTALVAIGDAEFADAVRRVIDRTQRLRAELASTSFDAGLHAAATDSAVIVLDGDLPGLDATAAIRSILALRSTRPTIVVLLAGPTPARVRELLGAGAREVIAKPSEPAAVAQRLIELMG